MQKKKKNKTVDELPVLAREITCEYPDPFNPSRASWSISNYYEIQDYDCLGDEEQEIEKEGRNENKKDS